MTKIKVFEAFAGYGSQAMALQRLKNDYPIFDFEVVGISEILGDAVKVYNKVHGNTKNYGDIMHIDWDNVPDFDLFTYSFPCQDISSMGKGNGFVKNSGTRSSLLWECEKTIAAKKPKYLMMENVKALVSKKNEANFKLWREWLENNGYTNYYKVLNSLDYGVPQSRNRVFMISILGEHEPFEFPKPFELKRTIESVFEKTIPQRCWKLPETDGKYKRKRINEMIADGKIDFSKTQFIDLYSWVAREGYASTLTTKVYCSGNNYVTDGGKLRKLTERECLRLMGVDDTDIDKMLSVGLHHSRYYAMAGNSIVVDVMYYLFRELFIPTYNANI